MLTSICGAHQIVESNLQKLSLHTSRNKAFLNIVARPHQDHRLKHSRSSLPLFFNMREGRHVGGAFALGPCSDFAEDAECVLLDMFIQFKGRFPF